MLLPTSNQRHSSQAGFTVIGMIGGLGLSAIVFFLGAQRMTNVQKVRAAESARMAAADEINSMTKRVKRFFESRIADPSCRTADLQSKGYETPAADGSLEMCRITNEDTGQTASFKVETICADPPGGLHSVANPLTTQRVVLTGKQEHYFPNSCFPHASIGAAETCTGGKRRVIKITGPGGSLTVPSENTMRAADDVLGGAFCSFVGSKGTEIFASVGMIYQDSEGQVKMKSKTIVLPITVKLDSGVTWLR